MNVRLYGFQLTGSPALNVDDFFAGIARDGGYAEFSFGDRNRILAVELSGPQIFGVCVTDTMRNSFNTMERDANGLPIIRVENTPGNNPMVEVNYFLVQRNTCRGLYSSHRGACSLNQFGDILRSRYNEAMQDLKDLEFAEYSESHGEEMPARQRNALGAKYKRGQFRLDPILQSGSFEKTLQSLQAVYAFEFVEPTVRDSGLNPIKKEIVMSRRSIRFKRMKQNRLGIISTIIQVIKDRSILCGRVKGKSQVGIDESIAINPDILEFAKYRYDDVALQKSLRLDGIAEIAFFQKIAAVINRYAVTFNAPSSP